MLDRDLYAQAVAYLHEAALFAQQAAMNSRAATAFGSNPRASVVFGVAITAVAGVAVAAAVGGTLIYTRRRRKRAPLSPRQWHEAFDSNSGRLIDPHKILKKIRNAGIDPIIRAQVWLFLLGFYDLDSTREEREAENKRKRDAYIDLTNQCKQLRESISEDPSESDEKELTDTGTYSTSSPSTEESNESSTSPSTMEEPDEPSGNASVAEELKELVTEDSNESSESETSTEEPQEASGNAIATEESTKSTGNQTEELKEPSRNASEDNTNTSKEKKAKKDWVKKTSKLKEDSLKTTEDFITWQRIIRLDAVRMNAEWVPYSPTQANVTQEAAWELASSVGLKDDEHLEPCRQHHAARLVSILEAYALYDPETGYCQGMSDLLSPFVALLDEDYEAFWCFVQFMTTARHNFRMDEIGIRRQLNKIAKIFQVSDPQLYSHIEKCDAQDCFFVYRMVVVLLRRELTFEQTISLWEVIWAEKKDLALGHTKSYSWRRRKKTFLTNDLILFVIAAAVRQRRKVIIEKCRGLDEILRECNSMAGHLDIWSLLDDAREMVSIVHGQIPE